MAIEANTPKDWGMRGATNTTLPQFKGKSRQLIVNIDDGYRPVIMDGITLGGRFKSASLDELNSGLAEKLGKTEKAESAKVADSANSVAGKNVIGTVANATNAVNAQTAINANHATSADSATSATTADSALSIDGANVTGTVANATNAVNATNAISASSVPWTGVTDKPVFATVATTGSYNDLTDKPSISSGIQSNSTVQVIHIAENDFFPSQPGPVIVYTAPADGLLILTSCIVKSGGSYTAALDVFGLFSVSAYRAEKDLVKTLGLSSLYLFVRKGDTIKATGTLYIGYITIQGNFFGIK